MREKIKFLFDKVKYNQVKSSYEYSRHLTSKLLPNSYFPNPFEYFCMYLLYKYKEQGNKRYWKRIYNQASKNLEGAKKTFGENCENFDELIWIFKK
jgi:hypothetical protein